MSKKCSTCGQDKSEQDFYKDRRAISGLAGVCKGCRKIAHQKWAQSDKGQAYRKAYLKEYRSRPEIKKRIKKQNREYKSLYRQTPRNRLNHNLNTLVWVTLKGGRHRQRWEKYVGYTIEELITHLEKQFTDKMNWDNYGSYWEVDHIKPKSLFKFASIVEEEFKKCWALDNLQPLKAYDNWKKHTTYK